MPGAHAHANSTHHRRRRNRKLQLKLKDLWSTYQTWLCAFISEILVAVDCFKLLINDKWKYLCNTSPRKKGTEIVTLKQPAWIKDRSNIRVLCADLVRQLHFLTKTDIKSVLGLPALVLLCFIPIFQSLNILVLEHIFTGLSNDQNLGGVKLSGAWDPKHASSTPSRKFLRA